MELQLTYQVELASTGDADALIADLIVNEVSVVSRRQQQRLGGDPVIIVAIAGSISAVAATLNRIAHSWQRDITIDARKKSCSVATKASSRGGRLIIVKPDGVDVYPVHYEKDSVVQRMLSRTIDR
jgi:hypothetical protein